MENQLIERNQAVIFVYSLAYVSWLLLHVLTRIFLGRPTAKVSQLTLPPPLGNCILFLPKKGHPFYLFSTLEWSPYFYFSVKKVTNSCFTDKNVILISYFTCKRVARLSSTFFLATGLQYNCH